MVRVLAVGLVLTTLGLGVAAGQEPRATLTAFDAVTVKPAAVTDGSWRIHFTATGFTARGVRLAALIAEAYDKMHSMTWFPEQIVGVPESWWYRQFDVEARVDAEDEDAFARLDKDGRERLLQGLLKDRFGLDAVEEERQLDVNLLEVAKGGARVGAPAVETEAQKKGPEAIRQSRPGLLLADRVSMATLARVVQDDSRKMVVDRTGLPGRYAFALHWTPEGEQEGDWPELARALEEQIGLRLVTAKIPVGVVVVKRVKEPTKD